MNDKFSKVEIFSLNLKRDHYEGYACIGIMQLPFEMLDAMKASFLHPEELTAYRRLHHPRKKHRFLQGRYIAKKTLAVYCQENDLFSLQINAGVFNQPLVNYPKTTLPAVSISHTDQYSVSLAFSREHPMGLDIEAVKPENGEGIHSQLTPYERALSGSLNEDKNVFYTRIWTIKEALSKVLMTGLMTPMTVYQIASLHHFDQYVVSTFSNFAQYKAVSFWWKGNICAIVLPRATQCNIPERILTLSHQSSFHAVMTAHPSDRK